MKFVYSSNENLITNFNDAVFNNLPEIGGLWMPEGIPQLDKNFINNLDKYNFIEIAKYVLSKFITDIPIDDLNLIIEKSYSFEPKLVKLNENQYILELFHGPSLAFKDFGAMFMGNLYSYLSKEEINIITATSGDTGGAVAHAFYNKKNIKVFILYPKGKVSKLQEKQLTTFGKNIFPIEIDGTFDDCQHLVKSTFNDKSIPIKIASANSINIARLLPQTLYYFYMYSELLKMNITEKIIVTVPSGNLGNITSGILAKKMGLPIDKFIAAVNINKTFYDFLKTGNYGANTSKRTLSNAMDVGNPSNFLRLDYLYPKVEEIRKDISSYYIDDLTTINSIKEVYKNYDYLMDPHTAVGYSSTRKFCEDSKAHQKDDDKKFIYILLSTAHPAKFKEEIESNTNITVNVPERLKSIMNKKSNKFELGINFFEWKNKLLELSTLRENMILIGMPYSGKTTYGKILEKQTGKKMIDTDKLIEKKYNKPLIEILNEYGNEKFLDIEADIIESINETNIIISTGGSSIYRERAMKHLNRMYGSIYYLKVPYLEIEKRCNNFDSRGVVLEENETLEDLYNKRSPLYEKYSNIVLENVLLDTC